MVAYEILKSGTDDLRIIISNQWVRIVTSTDNPNLTVLMETRLRLVLYSANKCNAFYLMFILKIFFFSSLDTCRVIAEVEGNEQRHYIELVMHVEGTSQFLEFQDPVRKPKVRCESAALSKAVSRQINYAKRLHDERLLTLISENITQAED